MVSALLASDIFCYVFDFDEWPSTSSDDSELVRAYNGNSLDIRSAYRDVFHEHQFRILDEQEEDLIQSNKIHKIRYRINMLPALGEHIV